MEHYEIEIRRTIEGPWLRMEPVRLGNVPRGLGTPDYYCTISCEDEPYLILYLYGSESLFVNALVWHTWLVVGFGGYIYFLSLEQHSQRIVFDIGYFCTLYPVDEYMLATTINTVLCFDQNAQLLWESEEVSLDSVSISSVEDDRIFGVPECPPFYDPLQRGPFMLSLHTGEILT